jgi:uncharacterized protein (TIGR03067 family)
MSLHALTILAATFVTAADAPDAKKELENLQGTWVAVALQEKGGEIFKFDPNDKREPPDVFVFKGDSLTITHGEQSTTVQISVDPKKKPSAIDLTFTEGKGKGKTNHAIYELNSDELKIRVDNKFRPNSAEDRPTNLSADKFKGDSPLLYFLKRKK